jgi:hypothetical protein
MKLPADVHVLFGDNHEVFNATVVKKGTPFMSAVQTGFRTITIEFEEPIDGYTRGRIQLHAQTPLNVSSYLGFLSNRPRRAT